MLDEIREYEEYTYDLDNTENPPKRIKYNVLTKGLQDEGGGIGCGIESILCIIARHFLFMNDQGAFKNAGAAECAISAWLGIEPDSEKMSLLSDETRAEIEAIRGWYPDYIKKILIPERETQIKHNEGNQKAINALKKNIDILKGILDNLRSETFRNNLNKSTWEYGYSGKNDYKVLFTEKVLANAAVRGPLRRRYLICLDPDLDSVVIKEHPKRRPKEGLTKREEYDDLYLRFISAWLLSQIRTKSDKMSDNPTKYRTNVNRSVPINMTEISGWALGDTKLAKDKIPDCFRGIILESVNKQQSKMYFYLSNNGENSKDSERWFESCGWNIIDATEGNKRLENFIKRHPEYCFWKDMGSGVPLVKNEKY